MTENIKEFDFQNIRVLYNTIVESGYEGYINWFKEQKPERQEYVLELMGNMISQLINTKTQCSKNLKESEKPSAQIVPLRKKPKLTVIK